MQKYWNAILKALIGGFISLFSVHFRHQKLFQFSVAQVSDVLC